MLEDTDAIRELLHRYCFYMDEGRFAELAALFSDDGEWVAPYRTAKGPADIAAWLRQSVPPSPRRGHYVMNSIIDDVYGDLVNAIATGRHKDPAQVRAILDNGPFLSTQAKQPRAGRRVGHPSRKGQSDPCERPCELVVSSEPTCDLGKDM